ncbi:protein fantom [Anguilla anguilla]|uniref:protein fantom n=1 Tax=Anguilla anguilla TaxID=7936 RepID=UPI0015AF58B9|nr:protein fantom [Anguilla anguilla]
MSLAMDETAGDLPVRDVGLRGGLPQGEEECRDVMPWRRPQVLKIRDRGRVFRQSREQIEEQCLRLQEENTLLRHHCRTQDHRLRRMSAKLLRLREGRAGSSGLREAELEETVQDLEGRVSALESQKRALQSKLSLARQHILELGSRATTLPYRNKGRGQDTEGGVRRAAQTAPPRYGLGSLQNTREETERLRCSVIETQQVRMAELESAVQSLRDALREKEREIEDSMRELRRQQADGHRVSIRENVDMIRQQKQLSEKSAALLVIQEKFTVLQEVYEAQLEESQRPLKESQEALLTKVEELTEQLKQERQRALCLEGQLTTATFSTQALEELQERLSDVAGERDLLRQSYDRLLESTLNTQNQQSEQNGRWREGEKGLEQSWRAELQQLEERLEAEQQERERLEEEKERMRQEKKRTEEEIQRERETSDSLKEKHSSLEQKVLQYREEVTSLQERLDSVTKEFDMSVEDLSETLLQIKAFRLQREGEDKLQFLQPDGKVEDCSRELTSLQASHAETVLELHKCRDMLLLQHRINTELQGELKTVIEGSEAERKENRKRLIEKDRLLERRAQRITTLQAQLKELAYSPKNYKRSIPLQYTWAGGDREVAEQVEDDTIFSQLRGGESLLEIHLRGATFTPKGLRTMGRGRDEPGTGGEDRGQEVVTFCTYSFLDFETHSTPLVCGPQPNYGFTSRYPLSARDLGQVRAQGGRVRVEVHQALGGVQFRTRGRAWIPLSEAAESVEQRLNGKANITGAAGEILGVLEYWVHLYPPTELRDTLADRRTAAPTLSLHTLTWEEGVTEEPFDYGGGIPNELEVVLDRCVGLSAHWPGLLPDTYLLYRLYDLPPHATPTIPGSADPVFGDVVSYPLAATPDLLLYLRGGSLWVYAFDDRDDQTASSYLAKTPIPLRNLATGRPIRGDYVLRDAGGCPHGMVRVSLRWKYPFQPPQVLQSTREGTESPKTAVAKPREVQSPEQEVEEEVEELVVEGLEEDRSEKAPLDNEVTESSESQASSGSDIIIVPDPTRVATKGNKLRVEILSLSLDPASCVALDQSVQRVYVEYRLLGVPMETTETPISLRKPIAGEEIHFNFIRVIYVDSAEAAPLRQYLYTMMEGTDPNQGRLKFTVVSEPMDEEEQECVDIGHAYLDLKEVLLTGSDVTERQLDIMGVGEEEEDTVGKLKVSLEAAWALKEIYWEHHGHRQREGETEEDEEEEEEEEEKKRGEKEQTQDDDDFLKLPIFD